MRFCLTRSNLAQHLQRRSGLVASYFSHVVRMFVMPQSHAQKGFLFQIRVDTCQTHRIQQNRSIDRVLYTNTGISSRRCIWAKRQIWGVFLICIEGVEACPFSSGGYSKVTCVFLCVARIDNVSCFLRFLRCSQICDASISRTERVSLPDPCGYLLPDSQDLAE